MAIQATEASARSIRFGDVVRLCTDRCADPAGERIERYVGLEHLEPGDLRIRKWGLVAHGTTFTNRFKPGQVLFGKRRAYQRKVAVADFEGVCSGDIYVLEPANGLLHPDLLPFLCQTDEFYEYAVGTSAGSLSPRTNWKSLADFKFVLPSLREQRRLVAVLTANEKSIAALRDVNAAGAKLEKTTFAHTLCGFLNGQVTALRPSRFGQVPADWELKPIDEIAAVVYGISESVASNKDPSIGWPILTGANISLAGALDFSKIVYIEKPKKADFVLQRGDLLLNWRSGSQEHVGKTAIFETDGDYTFASFVLRIRVDERTNHRYLWRLLNHMREYHLFGTATSQQVNFKMNAAMFRRIEVLAPPRRHQDQIVNHMQQHWTALEAIQERELRALSLRAQLLRDLTDG